MAADKTTHPLPPTELIAIDCPVWLGNPTERSSWDRLIGRLGGPEQLSAQLDARDPNRPLELQLGPRTSNDFIRPVLGEWVPSSNVLIKVIKRTRRVKKTTIPNGDGRETEPVRLYKIEPVGVITTVVRFRALGDYQYTPDLRHPINVLARDMRGLNAESVLKFHFEAETEDYSSSQLGLFPPPLFSRYLVPQIYQFKQNLASAPTETAEGVQRMINRTRYTCTPPQSITFDQPDVPQGPLPAHLEKKKAEDEPLYQKALSLFEQRPVWNRQAFQNHLSITELRRLRHNKHFLAYTCYMFSDGVFRELLIRFGYDPRVTPEARFYQRISLRNLDNKDAPANFTFKLKKRPVNKAASAESVSTDSPRDHIFDGRELHQSIGTYQLCDISDPLLVTLIKSPKGVLPHCRIRNGWYTSNAIEQIRSILRRKFHALLEEKRIVRDTECVDLLEIDVREEAVELLKKVTVAEMRRGYRNVKFKDAGGEAEDSSTTKERSQPLYPNPLLKSRRTKAKTKAKPADRTTLSPEAEGVLSLAETHSPAAQDSLIDGRLTSIAAGGQGAETDIEPDEDEEDEEEDEDSLGNDSNEDLESSDLSMLSSEEGEQDDEVENGSDEDSELTSLSDESD